MVCMDSGFWLLLRFFSVGKHLFIAIIMIRCNVAFPAERFGRHTLMIVGIIRIILVDLKEQIEITSAIRNIGCMH